MSENVFILLSCLTGQLGWIQNSKQEIIFSQKTLFHHQLSELVLRNLIPFQFSILCMGYVLICFPLWKCLESYFFTHILKFHNNMPWGVSFLIHYAGHLVNEQALSIWKFMAISSRKWSCINQKQTPEFLFKQNNFY